MTPGQRGRELARAEYAAAVAATIVCALMVLGAPVGPSPTFAPSYDALFLLAIAGLVIGFGWMTRIYRSNIDPDPHIWRYRERD